MSPALATTPKDSQDSGTQAESAQQDLVETELTSDIAAPRLSVTLHVAGHVRLLEVLLLLLGQLLIPGLQRLVQPVNAATPDNRA